MYSLLVFLAVLSKPYSEKYGLADVLAGTFFKTFVVTGATQTIVSTDFYVPT